MKKLFTNYNFEFTKNEKKILTTFCKQTLKQIEGDNKLFAEVRTFNSLLSKLTGKDDLSARSDLSETRRADKAGVIKLTKDELTKLKHQLEENLKYLNSQIKKSWFLKKWLYRSMAVQYENILNNHFRN